MADVKNVILYTDGACIGNPGPGGYGVVLLYGDRRKELAAGFRKTTNNRMEILAAIIGLQALKERCSVILYSDSAYLVNAMEQHWALKWKANGWKRGGPGGSAPVKNDDLWRKLDELSQKHRVRYNAVLGHSGHPENERCDQLAVTAYQKLL